jgi:Fe2+ or Zn2+ uptake regulation protein
MSHHYATFLAEDRRLVLLRVLSEMPSYRANSSVLTTALEHWGHTPTRDQVKTELSWLAEQGLVTTSELTGAVVLATLTERGQDVASGRARCHGVKRPGA